jgi:hypothetical protein
MILVLKDTLHINKKYSLGGFKVENKEEILNNMDQEHKDLKFFSDKNAKKQAARLAGTLLLTSAVTLGLAGCGGSTHEVKIDCSQDPENNTCVRSDFYTNGGGGFFYYGGSYMNLGVYHSSYYPDHSYGSSMSKGYSSAKAGSISG